MPGGSQFWGFVEDGERILDREGPCAARGPDRARRALLLGHKGYTLARQGRCVAAVETLRRASDYASTGSHRIRARTLADLADALCMIGNVEGAAGPLEQAEQLQVRFNLHIDYADHSVPVRAKLAHNRMEAYRLLRQAQRTLTEGGAKVALARNLLLQARLGARPCRRAKLHAQVASLVESTPSLRQCPAVSRVLSNWDAWAQRATEATGEGANDAFWNL